MTDQAAAQSTVSAAAAALESSPIMDSLLGDEPRDEDRGEPRQPKQQKQPEPEEVEADDDSEEQEDEQGSTDEPEESDEEEQSEPETESEIQSLDDLAKALELSPEEMLENLTAKVKIDGKEETVNLKEALAGYQKDADYRRKTAELAQQRREFEGAAQQRHQAIEMQHQVAAGVMHHMEQALMGEAQQLANDQKLRTEDPVAWATAHAQLTERQQQFQQLKQQAAQAYQQHFQQSQQVRSQRMQERLQQELQALTSALPEFEKVKPDIDSYLTDRIGFSNEELSSVSDHRLVLLAHKAMLYDKGQNQTDRAKSIAMKKVKQAPKMQKPAKPGPALSPKVKKISAAKKRLKRSGHVRDAASAIENLI